MSTRSSSRRPDERARLLPTGPGHTADTIAVIGFVGGLVLWYAGGHPSMNVLLDGSALRNGVLLAAALGAVLVLLTVRGLSTKKLFGSAAMMAAAVAISGSSLAAMANRTFDGSPARESPAQIVSYKKRSKGPKDVIIAIEGRRLSFYASHAPRPPCAEGSPATVRLRAGALGMRWLESVRCTPAPIAPGGAPR